MESSRLDKKTSPYTCCLQEIHLRSKDTHRLKVKGWKKIFHANGKEIKAGVTVLISDKIDYKTKGIVRGEEGHFIMIKGPIQQEDITLVNIYAPNTGAPKHVKQIFLGIKGEISRNTIIVRDFNTPLISVGRSSRQKVNKERVDLTNTLDQMDLNDIFRAFHPNAAKYIYFSSAHGMFPRIDHMLGHKISLNEFKKTEVISSTFSGHKAMELEINH